MSSPAWVGVGLAAMATPLLYWAGFHDPFLGGKLLSFLPLGVTAGVLLTRGPEKDPLGRARLVLGAFLLTMGLVACGRGVPWPLLLRWLPLVAFPLATMECVARLPRTGIRGLAVCLGVGAWAVLAIGLVRRHLGWPDSLPDRVDVALASTIGNSNELGEYAAPLAVLSWLPLLAGHRVAGLLLFLPASALTVLSNSRAAWLAWAVGLAVVALVVIIRPSVERDDRSRRRRTGLVLGGGLVILVAIAWSVPAVRERVATSWDPNHPTNAVRLGLWSGTLDLIADHPWLGCGVGSFERTFPPYRSGAEWQISGFSTLAEDPHQEVLWLVAENGLMGAAFLVVALGFVLRWGRRALHRTGHEPTAAVLLGSLAATGALMLLRSPLHHLAGSLPLAVTLGLLASHGADARVRPGAARAGRVIVGVLVVGALFASVHLLRQHHLVHQARWALVRGQEAVQRKDLASAASEWTQVGRHLRTLAATAAADPALTYRTALVGSDLALVRQGLEKGSTPPEIIDPAALPSVGLVQSLFDHTIRMVPGHHAARIASAELALRSAEPGGPADPRAVDLLTEQLEIAPQTPQILPRLMQVLLNQRRFSQAREVLLRAEVPHEDPSVRQRFWGLINLRTGSDAQTFGAWLDPHIGQQTEELAERLKQAATSVSVDPEGAYDVALEAVGKDPFDLQALTLLADATTQLASAPSDVLRPQDAGDLALARQRLTLALESEGHGAHDLAETHLRIARRKDPYFLDALYLEARILARRGDGDAALARLRDLITAGVPRPEVLRRALDDEGAGFGSMREALLGL